MRFPTLFLALMLPAVVFGQKVPPGFECKLLFKAPEIEHPSCVTCDDDGNLFIGEDPMDMRGPSTKEFDRILLAKWDGKGGCRKTVFAKGLSAVFGMQWYDGWLYVMHAPHYSRFKDLDGDGVADVREDLAEGFGAPAGVYGFNDHIVSGIRLGMDGWMYVSVGDKGIPKAVGRDKSTITLEGGGVVRMRPDGTKLEIFSTGTRNHLDVAMDCHDNIFTYDNTDDGLGWWTRFTHHVPGGYYGYPFDYLKHPERHLPCISEHGGGSPCGGACYNEAAWPRQYRGNPFFAEWGKGKVQCFHLTPKGATFTATIEDFMTSDGSGDFRPVDLCFSPDGRHMYLADWNFGGWLQAKQAGRVYRITYVGKDLPPEPPRGTNADPVEKQIAALKHPAFSERLRAQRWIEKAGETAVVAAGRSLVKGIGDDPGPIHALWAMAQAAKTEADGEELAAIVHLSIRRRASSSFMKQALRVAYDHVSDAMLLQLFEDLLWRFEPEVVAENLRCLSRLCVMKEKQKVVLPNERRLVEFLRLTLLGAANHPDPVRHLCAIRALRELNDWSSFPVGDETNGSLLIEAARGVYDPAAAEMLVGATSRKNKLPVRVAAFRALAEVHHKAAPYTSGWWGTQPARVGPARTKNIDWEGTSCYLRVLPDLLSRPNPMLQIEALRIVRALQTDIAAGMVLAVLQIDRNDEVRKEAIITLGALRDPESTAFLVHLAGDKRSSEPFRQEALRSLTSIAPKGIEQQIVAIASDAKNSSEIAGLALEALTSIPHANPAAAVSAVEARLGDARPALRVKAVAAYAKLRNREGAARLTGMLKDASVDVRLAVLRSLVALKSPEATPAILEAVHDPAVRFEALLALAAAPDRRALQAYLSGVVDKSPEIRTACRSALVKIRDQIGSEVVELHRRNELPLALRTELQTIFAASTPLTQWLVAGPWPKGRRPELNSQSAPDPKQKFNVGDATFGWKKLGPANEEGMIDLLRDLAQQDGVWAVAYAPIESTEDAVVQAQVGSDDQIQLFLNGRKVHQFDHSRGWAAEQDVVRLPLRKGVNHLYAVVGNDSGPWAFSVRLARRDPKFAFLYDAPKKLEPAAYAAYARTHKGDPARGRAIFLDPRGVGCVKCHAVGGVGGSAIGPDLAGVGAKYPKDEIIRSILEPSNRILSGYQMTQFQTKDGVALAGIIKKENAAEIEIVTSEAKTIKLPAGDVEARKLSNLSLMPAGLSEGMSTQDFADLVAYLEGLKEAGGKK